MFLLNSDTFCGIACFCQCTLTVGSGCFQLFHLVLVGRLQLLLVALLKSNNDQVKPENTVKLRIRKNKNIPAKY